MNILYIGAGFVGSCSAAVSADSGHSVLVYDIDTTKITALNSLNRSQIEATIMEEGLVDLLTRHKDRLTFTAQYADVEIFLNTCDAVFMCLPTPEIGETGDSNLTYYHDAAKKLATSLAKRNNSTQERYIVIVNKSTVPIDMVNKTEELCKEYGVINVGVVSNPEFLVEGKAITGSLKPDRIVIGAWKEQDFAIMRLLYQRFYDSPTVEYIEVNPFEAAAGKLIANFYLFNKLALCFDVMGRTAEAFPSIHFENLRRILTSEPRIGTWGFYDSLYAGGSCFIKDARSLAYQLAEKGMDTTLVNTTYAANKRQLEHFMRRAEEELLFDWTGKTIAIFGAAFKRDTNDIRNSPTINFIDFLQTKHVSRIGVFDPAIQTFIRSFPANEQLWYPESQEELIDSADVVVISTDWPQFRSLGDLLVKKNKKLLILDGRRMLQQVYDELQGQGCTIIAVGSPIYKPRI